MAVGNEQARRNGERIEVFLWPSGVSSRARVTSSLVSACSRDQRCSERRQTGMRLARHLGSHTPIPQSAKMMRIEMFERTPRTAYYVCGHRQP